MSTTAAPLIFAATASTTAPPPNPFHERRQPVTRRGNYAQGRALETLAHAIEYLSDSQMFEEYDGTTRQGDAEAIRVMTRASRAVFEECAEVKPLRRRLSDWLHRL